VTELAIGGSLHVSDLVVPAGVKVLEDPNAAVVNIMGKAKEETAIVEEEESL
jgi:large subunit ribosomal protein L25